MAAASPFVKYLGVGADFTDRDNDKKPGSRCELWSHRVGGLLVASQKKKTLDSARILSSGGNLKDFLQAAKEVRQLRHEQKTIVSSDEGRDDLSDASEKLDDLPFGQASESEEHVGGVTTMMIRNIPPKLTQHRLLEEIRKGDFGEIDFCYMPSSYTTGQNHGYAFVNFKLPESAKAFTDAWQSTYCFGKRLTPNGEKAINISPAQLQGKKANLRLWNSSRMRRVRNEKYRPFIGESKPGVVNIDLVSLLGDEQVSPVSSSQKRPTSLEAAPAIGCQALQAAALLPLSMALPPVAAASRGSQATQPRIADACDSAPTLVKMAWDPMGLSG